MLNNNDPLRLKIGNPNLLQDNRHFAMIRYSNINPMSMNSFFGMLSFDYTFDYIGYRTIIAENEKKEYQGIVINQGSQLQLPENLDGYFNVRSFFTYSIPIEFIKSNINLNAGFNYSKTPSIINDVTNYANSNSINFGFVLASNISQNLDFNIFTLNTFSQVKNTSYKSSDANYFTQFSKVRLNWTIWNGIVFRTDFEYRYNGGLSSNYDPNSYLLNFSLGKKLFNKDQGEIRLSVYDALNKNISNQRTVTETYIEDSNSNVIGRYVLLSFIYDIKVF